MMAESEVPVPSFSTVLEYLHITLRYVASGFVAVGVYMFLYHVRIDFTEKSWFLIFLTAAIGIITYALHFATLDKFFYGNCTLWFMKNNDNYVPDVLKENIITWKEVKKEKPKEKEVSQNAQVLKSQGQKVDNDAIKENEFIVTDCIWNIGNGIFIKAKEFIWCKHNYKLRKALLFALANQTYLRQISNKKQLVDIQNLVEKRLALLNFLYCSFYQVAIISLYCGIKKIIIHCKIEGAHLSIYNILAHDMRLVAAIIFSFIILYSAIEFNKRICGREMWLVTNFPQYVDKLQKEIEKEKPETNEMDKIRSILFL